MKLKMFSMLAVVLFMMSSVNLNANSENNSFEEDPYACWGVADATLASFQKANIKLHQIATYEQEYNVWASAYDACMGAQQPVIIG